MTIRRSFISLLFAFVVMIVNIAHAKHLQVLFLGNSYTASNNLPQMVQDIASAYGDTLTYQAITPGGQYLLAHSGDNSVQSAIQQGGWDYILMQEQSQIPTIPHSRETLFMPGADSLRTLRNMYSPGAELRFFLTWGRENGGQQCNPSQTHCSVPFSDFHHYQDTLTWAYQRNADSIGAGIAPVGEMWREALLQHNSNLPTLNLFSSDGSHPNTQGSYLAGLAIYTTLFQKPVSPQSPQVTSVDSSLDAFFRQIVDNNVWPRKSEWRLKGSLISGGQCASASNTYSFNFNNQTYEVISEQRTWKEAAACAVASGGKLVEINSQAEQDTVWGAITNDASVNPGYTSVSDGGGIAYVWIGATDRLNEGQWLWDGDADSTGVNFWNGEGSAGSGNGSPAGGNYNNWGGSSQGFPNEPDNFNGIQHAAAIGLSGWPSFNPGNLGQAGEWNDIDTTNQLYYVIEYPCANTTASISDTACDSYTSPSGGQVWTKSGTFQDTIAKPGGCDSIITVNLTINNTTTASISDTGCGSYTSPSGNQVWTNSGMFQDTITKPSGCDSIINVNLTIDNTTTASISDTGCGSYTSPSGNQVWTNSGMFQDTITKPSGCDSIVNVNLTINNSTTASISDTGCDSYTSPSGSQVWTKSGTFQDTIAKPSGCDSIITVNLTINNTTTASISDTGCGSYTSPSGNQVWTNSGTFQDTITKPSGCDSIITVNLTIDTVNTTVSKNGPTLEAEVMNASYQWLDCNNNYAPIQGETARSFTASSNGNYAVEVNNNGCIDTSDCKAVTNVGIGNLSSEEELVLYPSITSDHFVLELDNITKTDIRIFNTDGRTILQREDVKNSTQRFSLSQEQSGLYFVKVTTPEASHTLKVIKQ